MVKKMNGYSPILDDGGAIWSAPFGMLSNLLYSDAELIKVSEHGGGSEEGRTGEPNFFRCFPNCCALEAAL
jgi:hypothetical protein